MIYLRCALVGLSAAVAAALIFILGVFVFPLVPLLLSRPDEAGAGAVGVAFSTGPLLVLAIIAFALGFSWQFRRGSK